MITLVFIFNDQCLPLELDKCVTNKPRVKTSFLQQLGWSDIMIYREREVATNVEITLILLRMMSRSFINSQKSLAFHCSFNFIIGRTWNTIQITFYKYCCLKLPKNICTRYTSSYCKSNIQIINDMQLFCYHCTVYLIRWKM